MKTTDPNEQTELTPRTDEFRTKLGWCNCESYKLLMPFARTLERELNAAIRRAAQAEKERDEANRTINHLLAHCKDAECEECSRIVCPHEEPLHFHHDGCPACVTYEQMQHQLSSANEALKLAVEALTQAQRSWRGRFSKNVDELTALTTPFDKALSHPAIQAILGKEGK